MSLENKINGNFFRKFARKAAPYVAAAALGIATLAFFTNCPVPAPNPHPKKYYKNDKEQVIPEEKRKIVLLAMDDIQIEWLKNVQEYIVQRHIDERIPVTLGVIPSGIENPETGNEFAIKIKNWDDNPTTEVAQHGYDHLEENKFEGKPYATQYNQISLGKNLINDAGIDTNSFIPPYCSADDTTIRVLRELGFHTFYSPLNKKITATEEPVIINNQLFLAKGDADGKDAVFKDYNVIKSEIEQKISQYGVALVLYHMQDFEVKAGDGSIDTTKTDQLVNYAEQLKTDGYTLMTVEDYNYYLHNVKHYPK